MGTAAATRRSPARGRAAVPRRGAGAPRAPRTRLRIVHRGRAAAARPASVGAGLLDRLIRGPGWILCIGALLVGVVFFNVSLLELNRGITANSDHAAELRRANAELRLTVAKLASSERIQLAARQRGFVLPPPGEVRYLRASRLRDARLAARRIAPPSVQAVPSPAPAPVQQQQTAPAPVQPQPAAPTPAQEQPPATQPPATTAQPTPAQATGGQ